MKKLFVISLIGALWMGCKDEPSTGGDAAKSNAPTINARPAPTGKTEIGNFEYWHHIKNEGAKPLPSQAVFYSYQITRAGQVIQTNFGESPSGGIMPTEEEAKKNPQALAEAMRRMAVGDSMTIIYPMKSSPDSNLVYDLVLRAIHSR